MFSTPGGLKVALLSSGLGHVTRGIEVWMEELFRHWPASIGPVELWSGARVEGIQSPLGPSRYRPLHGLGRENRLLSGYPWSRRYEIEQLSVLPRAISRLRRWKADIAYCGDPVLTWHLKRFQRWHGASVVFMNGMRLSPKWGNHLDGVHLLADPYLEEANAMLGGERQAEFFAVPHFADTEIFRPADDEARLEARRRFGIPLLAYVVLTVGPVGNVSGKRLDFLANEVASAGAPVYLVHAGIDEDGAVGLRNSIQMQLGDRAVFLGRVDRAQMPDLYRAADCYSLGSLAEPFSIAILEALASGLPVVHHADPVMIWQSGPGGLPVSMTQAGQAASVFSRLASDPAEQAAIKLAARSSAVQRYEPKAISLAIGESLLQVRKRCG